jgi:hypothetical protein
MIVTSDDAALSGLPAGAHVCWVVDDPATFVATAAGLLVEAASRGAKPIVFGPRDGAALAALAEVAATAVDPRVALLDEGPFDPHAMFAAFRRESAAASDQGYRGLCVVADMDWLLPSRPSTEAIIGFEVLLDQLVAELGAIVVCAYRTASFDTGPIAGALCVHRDRLGGQDPPFQLVAAGPARWSLGGEVDLSVRDALATALQAAAGTSGCVLDTSSLRFIDVAGMRTIAAVASSVPVRVEGAPPVLRRAWSAAGFADDFPDTLVS